jgi:hypothetical protein
LICKLAVEFLGSKQLSLMYSMHYKENNTFDELARKIYIWTVYYKDNERVPNPFVSKFKECNYEGFEYRYIENQVSFF